ncbi:MAG: hypothetical protein EA367_15815 [Leptolyngbya sp. DLM2.Bin15]|nr:MAG: hypothetical protein EA367_15815 [Leptolyngbya sp. DLM2.Bin15]
MSIAGAWAWLIATGFKQIEQRIWKTSWRGKVLLHVSTSTEWDSSFARFGVLPEECPKAAIIGMAELTDCIWLDDLQVWGHCFSNPVLFETPVPNVKGNRNYWTPKTPEHEAAFEAAWIQAQSPADLMALDKMSGRDALVWMDSPLNQYQLATGNARTILSKTPVPHNGKLILINGSYYSEDEKEAMTQIIKDTNSALELFQEYELLGWLDITAVEKHDSRAYLARHYNNLPETSRTMLQELEIIYVVCLGDFKVVDRLPRTTAEGLGEQGFWMAQNERELEYLQECVDILL